MTIMFEYWFKAAFDFRRYHVYFKVQRERPEFWPWERFDWVYFDVEQAPDDRWPGKWCLRSRTDKSDQYLLEKYGKTTLYFKTRKELSKVLEDVIRDWHKTYYSGGKELPIVFV